MSLVEQVKSAVIRERKNDATLQRISDKFHIPQSHVANLLNGKRSFGGITLDTFDRMFPRASVFLNGKDSTQSIGDNSNGNIQQIGANVVTNVKRDDIRDYQLKVLQAIIALDLDAKAKDAVLTAINQVI